MSELLKFRGGSEYAVIEATMDVPFVCHKGDRLICFDADVAGRAYVIDVKTFVKSVLFEAEYRVINGLKIKEVKNGNKQGITGDNNPV